MLRRLNQMGLWLAIAGTLLTGSLAMTGCAELAQEQEAQPAVVDILVILQEGNNLPKTQLQPKQSGELKDNRIGSMWVADIYTEDDADWFVHNITRLGLKWVRLSIDYFVWDKVDWGKGEYSKYYIDPYQAKAIADLADNDIKVMYCLVFWDIESPGKEVTLGYSRFKTDEEIQRYLDYVQFIVHHFKDRIEYYEIWNEPESLEGTQHFIEVADYINIVRRVVPVIREEYPEAKIVVGATCNLRFASAQEYTFGILKSDIMPLVDAVSFHPMYGTSPEYDFYREYYYNYPSLIEEMNDVASAHGFEGEYIAEEMCWRTLSNPNPEEPRTYSELVAAKYYARAIIIHLGMNITAGIAGEGFDVIPPIVMAVQHLCTVMAGAEPVSIPTEMQSEAPNIVTYGFSLPSGDKLLAFWTDGVAIDDDPGIEATLTLPGFSAQKVVGIDVLNGFEQQLVTSVENGNLIIRNLLVKDYPIILRIGD